MKKNGENQNYMIKYEDIAKANESIRTTDIKGKEYAEVNQRIKAFRMVHPNGVITTNIVSLENGVVIMKATIMDEEDREIGTGYAYEQEGSTFINKTSFIENCETSAVGRALGMCGFGIDTSVASYEEVQNAMNNQEPSKEQVKPEPKVFKATAKQVEMLSNVYKGENLIKLLKANNIQKLEDLPIQKASDLIKAIKEKGAKKHGTN